MNARETMRRNRAWRGSSRLIIDPKNSRNSGGMSPMLVPFPLQNSSGCRLASTTSAWRVRAVVPGPGAMPGGGSGSAKNASSGRARRVAKAAARSLQRALPELQVGQIDVVELHPYLLGYPARGSRRVADMQDMAAGWGSWVWGRPAGRAPGDREAPRGAGPARRSRPFRFQPAFGKPLEGPAQAIVVFFTSYRCIRDENCRSGECRVEVRGPQLSGARAALR